MTIIPFNAGKGFQASAIHPPLVGNQHDVEAVVNALVDDTGTLTPYSVSELSTVLGLIRPTRLH